MSDQVHISGLQSSAILGLDHWQKPVPQPISVDVTFSTDFEEALKSDNLHYSLNYAVISDKIATFLRQQRQKNFQLLGGVGAALFDVLESERAVCSAVKVDVSAPKLDILAQVLYSSSGVYLIKGLRVLTLIGVFTFERLHRQYVLMDIDLEVPSGHLAIPAVSEKVHQYLEQANFKTVEALVQRVGQLILQNYEHVEKAHVRVTKPNALVYVDGVGVSCTCTRANLGEKITLEESKAAGFDLPVETQSDYLGSHTAYIAFGSNEGDQLAHIQRALNHLLQEGIMVKATSSLYVSRPMYYTEQADFYNGVVKVSFDNLSPHDLLKVLKRIEYEELARTKAFDNGPRTIDLDLVLYDSVTVTSEDLVVPHKSMLERTFVLQPLCELLLPDYIHPVTAEPVHNHLAKLLSLAPDPQVQESSELVLIVPGYKKVLSFGDRTLVMGIFNTTPDLFSDGGSHFELDKAGILETARKMAEDCEIIDIGGVSTRPGSDAPLLEEELRRVVPVVEAIRGEKDLDHIFISVDTYRSEVAERVLQLGADIVNDVSMGLYDSKMFLVVAKYQCAYVMNHTRGTPETMLSLIQYGAAPENLVEYHIDSKTGFQPPLEEPAQSVINGVCRELCSQIDKAMEQGVRRWQVILDPGVGFAKDLKQNLALVRYASRVKQYSQYDSESQNYSSFHGMPMLVGTSRKRFLGTITGKPAGDRMVETVASVAACVEQDTDIVRVHDVADVKKAVQVADAIYRNT